MRNQSVFKPSRLALAACVTVIFSTPSASAQAPAGMDAGTKARIDKIYDEALAALDKHDTATACPKLEEVTRLAPQAVGARITLGECYESAGKLASAWSQYVAAEAMATNAGQEARIKKAAARATELKPRLATLTIEVPEIVRKTPGLVITRDGAPMVDAQWNTPLPTDKGAHTIVASASGRVTWTGTIEVARDGDKKSISVPPLKDAPAGAPAVTVTSTATAAPDSDEQPRSKLPAFVLGGAGLAAMLTGGALLGVAVAKGSDLQSTTPKDAQGTPLCRSTAVSGEDPACASAREGASGASLMGNVGIGVLAGGGALVAAGVVFLLLPGKRAPARQESFLAPIAGPNGGGLLYTGSF